MSPRTTRLALSSTALLAAGALTLAGCSGSESDPASGGETTELTISTFNDFGYTDELLQQYTDETGITIVQNKAATSNDARANFFQKLGNTGLADIEAVEIDWAPEMMEYADLLAPVPSELDDRWVDWKNAPVTNADGQLVGYGTDIGPQAVCYRADLFEEAGLPTDPEEVAGLFTTWDDFFDTADEYVEATRQPFIDSVNSVTQGLMNQQDSIYEDDDNTVIATENPAVREVFDTVVERAIPVAKYAAQWSDDWFASLANGEYPVMLCPPWLRGNIEGEGPDVTGWNIANVFPGGGSNWGGSYLVIPANGENVEAAQDFAEWLTSPEVQLQAFENAGTFPSQVDTYEDEALTSATDEFFNDAPVGQIGADRAEAVEVEPHKGPLYFQIHDAFNNAIQRVFDGTEPADEAWDTWVSEVDAL